MHHDSCIKSLKNKFFLKILRTRACPIILNGVDVSRYVVDTFALPLPCYIPLLSLLYEPVFGVVVRCVEEEKVPGGLVVRVDTEVGGEESQELSLCLLNLPTLAVDLLVWGEAGWVKLAKRE